MDEGSDPIDDEIVAARIIPALIAIRTELGCSIHAAIDEFARRYDRLRLERPDDFTVPVEQYGRGVYS